MHQRQRPEETDVPKTITKKAVETAIATGPGGKPYIMLWDSGVAGFGLRIRANGGASWLLRYRPKNAARGAPVKSMTLGVWPAMTVEAARALALGHVGKIALGGDPADELRQARARSRSIVGAALDDYAMSLAQRHIVKADEVMASLRRGFAPEINSEIGDLDVRTLVGLVDRIATTKRKRKDGTSYTVPGAAAEFRKNARAFLGWAALKGLVKFNALAGYRAPAKSRMERRIGKLRSGRALDDREIVAVWDAAESMGAFGALVRLGVLTGLRRNELAELRWSDIRDGMIVIPEGRTKTGREHRVPVTETMQSVLAALPGSTKGALVFPSAVTGSAMAGWSKLTPKLAKASGVSFRLHDLRRTCRTIMSRLGVSEAVAEAAIGHARAGLIATYDKHDLWNERVAAFEAVSAHVARIVAAPVPGDTGALTNVVPLTRKAS